jgi:peptidoglycan-associated lipoprotein
VAPPPTSTATVAVVTPPPPAPTTPVASLAKGEAMPDLLFDLDSHLIINATSLADLKRVAEELRSDSSKRVLVRGHSDAMGTPEYKRALSQRRAATVQGFLIAHGAPADRISIEAAADSDPADPGSNPVAWSKNRRVQVLWR